jgi:hypothetical protein
MKRKITEIPLIYFFKSSKPRTGIRDMIAKNVNEIIEFIPNVLIILDCILVSGN